MKNILIKLLDKIYKLEDYGYLIILLAVFLHFCFIVIFYFLDIKEMFYFNIFSTTLYIILSISFNNQNSKTHYIIAYIEVLSHQLAGIYYTGAASGFDLVLCCLILVQFLFFTKFTCFISTIFISIIIYLSYFEASSIELHSEKLFTINNYINANIILYPINLAILLTFLIAYGILVTAIPSKRIHDLKEIIYKDFLTGLFNRKYVEEIILSKINKESSLFAICDIDNFKHINDTYGHQTGDIVLKMLAIVLINKAKKYSNYDFNVSRWGGEEFLIIANIASLDLANQILNDIREDVEKLQISDLDEQITITIGASLASLNSNDYKQIFELADKNLYVGKKTGKNNVVITKNIFN